MVFTTPKYRNTEILHFIGENGAMLAFEDLIKHNRRFRCCYTTKGL